MNKIYTILVISLLYVNNVLAIDPPFDVYPDINQNITWGTEGDTETFVLTTKNAVTVYDGYTLIVYGNLEDTTNDELIIQTGATIIIYGNLNLTNTKSTLDGTVIVTGDVYLKNTDMISSGNLIVGGTLSSDSGNLQGITGDVYLLDPSANPSPPELPNGTQKTAEQLLTDESSDIIDLVSETVGSVLTYTWQGDVTASKTDWSVALNWESEAVPTELNSVIIPASPTGSIYPSIFSEDKIYSVRNLYIESGATLTIPAGTRINVKGDLTIDGTLIVNNTSSLPVSIIVDGSISGNATVNWNYLTTGRYWYMGACVESATVSGTENTYYVYDNSPAALTWSTVTTGFGRLDAIAVETGTSKLFSYSGTFNNATSYPFSVTGSGEYKTFANPYPSYLNFQEIYDAGMTGFQSSYWIFTDGSNYDVYNAAAGEQTGNTMSQYIAPGQSVWVKTNATPASFDIYKTYCEHQSSVSLKSSAIVDDRDKIRLNLTNGSVQDEALILFADFGSEIFTDYDSQKRFSRSASGNLSTIKDGKYAVINSMPTVYSEEVVPLSVYFPNLDNTIKYKLQVSELSGFDDNVGIYLIDNDGEGVEIDLRDVKEYSFTPSAKLLNDRFQIKVVPSVTTDISDEEIANNTNDVDIYSIQQKAIVESDDSSLQANNKYIYMYNLAGQLVYQSELNKLVTEIDLPQLNTIYIVKVIVDGKSYQKKVISKD